MSLLEVRGLRVAYGVLEVVKGIDLTIEPGELVALIGGNGAGKTTTLKALCGLLLPKAGTVVYNGHSTAGLQAHQLVARGLCLVPEGRGIFSRLTVLENLEMGAYTRRDKKIGEDLNRVYEFFPRLAERRHQKGGTLSGGEQQMLAIGRALMGRPKLLLLDEPSMGLAPLLVKKIFEIVREIASRGTTLLLVEQNARLALAVADRGYVMESGQMILSATASELSEDPQVKRAYLGG